MTRGILIAGNESSLFTAAAAEAVKRVESFASAPIPNRLSLNEGKGVLPPGAKTAGAFIPLSWNPSSSISARTLVLAAENRLGQINDAIVICSPPAVFRTAETLTPEEIEILVNDHIKGWYYLVRELALYFRRFGSGSLSLVTHEINGENNGKINSADLLGPSAAAAFRAFARGILALSANEPYLVMGFDAAEAGSEAEFAAWFFKMIDEGSKKNSGRWHRYSKFKLFR